MVRDAIRHGVVGSSDVFNAELAGINDEDIDVTREEVNKSIEMEGISVRSQDSITLTMAEGLVKSYEVVDEGIQAGLWDEIEGLALVLGYVLGSSEMTELYSNVAASVPFFGGPTLDVGSGTIGGGTGTYDDVVIVHQNIPASEGES